MRLLNPKETYGGVTNYLVTYIPESLFCEQIIVRFPHHGSHTRAGTPRTCRKIQYKYLAMRG